MLEAMKILGYGDIFSTRDMIQRGQGSFCAAILESKMTGVGMPFGIEQFESLFGDYRVVSGEFPAYMAEDVIKAYPDSKIILTVRSDEEKWLQSLLSSMWHNYSTWEHWFLRKFDRQWAAQMRVVTTIWDKAYMGDPTAHGLRVYREHNAMVNRIVEPKERLLVYDTQQGWDPLCEFLEKDVPEQTFPWVNRAEEHRHLFADIRRKHLRAWLGSFLVRSAPTVGAVVLLCFKSRQIRGFLAKLWR